MREIRINGIGDLEYETIVLPQSETSTFVKTARQP